jgi:hypothetical protein
MYSTLSTKFVPGREVSSLTLRLLSAGELRACVDRTKTDHMTPLVTLGVGVESMIELRSEKQAAIGTVNEKDIDDANSEPMGRYFSVGDESDWPHSVG